MDPQGRRLVAFDLRGLNQRPSALEQLRCLVQVAFVVGSQPLPQKCQILERRGLTPLAALTVEQNFLIQKAVPSAQGRPRRWAATSQTAPGVVLGCLYLLALDPDPDLFLDLEQ